MKMKNMGDGRKVCLLQERVREVQRSWDSAEAVARAGQWLLPDSVILSLSSSGWAPSCPQPCFLSLETTLLPNPPSFRLSPGTRSHCRREEEEVPAFRCMSSFLCPLSQVLAGSSLLARSVC